MYYNVAFAPPLVSTHSTLTVDRTSEPDPQPQHLPPHALTHPVHPSLPLQHYDPIRELMRLPTQ